MDIIQRRPDPIPFFGELASLNPVVVTAGAAVERGEPHVAELVVGSFTLGAGQFCTKPGLALVPAGAHGDPLVAAMAAAVAAREPVGAAERRHPGRRSSASSEALAATEGVQVARAGGRRRREPGRHRCCSAPPPPSCPTQVTEECFGPVSVVVRYDGAAELLDALDRLPSSLTATVHRGAGDDATCRPSSPSGCAGRAGRIVYDG